MSGIVDNHKSNKPTVIVPDIHGRPVFVDKVFTKYSPKEWDIVFLGDIIHTEGTAERWRDIWKEYLRTKSFGEDMWAELQDSIGALDKIVQAQVIYPESVFCVRGNHDDMTGKFVGNFGKYLQVGESAVFALGFKTLDKKGYEDYLHYEVTLPYVYVGRDFLCSHTVPQRYFSREDVKCDEKNTHVNFTWTDNVDQKGPWVKQFQRNMISLSQNENCRYWFIGHRPCDHNKLTRNQMNKRLIQVNHPKRHVVIEVHPNEPFKALVLE